MQTPRCRASSEMRILIPDLAQQDHSSSKIAVSYGLILEEYYMQRRKIQIWLGILAICTSLGTPISTYADTQDVTTNVGDKTTIKSDGSDKETTNGQEDSSDTTSGGDTTVHYTEAQLKAMDAKKKLNYELRSILTEVRKNADENGMFHSPNSSIKDIGYSYGTVDVKKDQIDQILDYLKDFESVLNKDNNRQDFDVISSVTNPIFDNMHMPKKSFSEPTIEDGGGKIALMDKNGDLSLIVSASDAPSDGLLATYEKSVYRQIKKMEIKGKIRHLQAILRIQRIRIQMVKMDQIVIRETIKIALILQEIVQTTFCFGRLWMLLQKKWDFHFQMINFSQN